MLVIPGAVVHETGRRLGGGVRIGGTIAGQLVAVAATAGLMYWMVQSGETSPFVLAIPYVVLAPIGATVGYQLGTPRQKITARVIPIPTDGGAGLALHASF